MCVRVVCGVFTSSGGWVDVVDRLLWEVWDVVLLCVFLSC